MYDPSAYVSDCASVFVRAHTSLYKERVTNTKLPSVENS